MCLTICNTHTHTHTHKSERRRVQQSQTLSGYLLDAVYDDKRSDDATVERPAKRNKEMSDFRGDVIRNIRKIDSSVVAGQCDKSA